MYGTDVKWQSGEIAAFRIFNRLCREQAEAVFEYDRRAFGNCLSAGKRPDITPAADLAARARAEAVL